MILKRFIVVVVLIFTVVACKKINGPKKPKNLISKDKMVDILIDAKLITTANSKNKIIMRDAGLDFKTYVYEKHNIDSLQFALSNDYYAFHMEEYEEIYTRLADSLLELKEELKTIEAEEWKEKTKREADSLNQLLEENKKNKDSLGLENLIKKDSLVEDNAFFEESVEELESLLEPISDSLFQ
ncbi:DUF4296 domain-containing protein [Algibacter sp. R77976]|uniref:DUF4296 domain-containing protein n=1 Tax=Algibacter sp. R77976 TaxID=3093873 RepID=UPI0037C9CF24